eukprot:3244830-Pyramimonas_sp.AAC.1
MFVAAAHVRDYVKHVVADSLELKQHWALQALRGWRLGKVWLVHRALRCYRALHAHFCPVSFQCTRVPRPK